MTMVGTSASHTVAAAPKANVSGSVVEVEDGLGGPLVEVVEPGIVVVVVCASVVGLTLVVVVVPGSVVVVVEAAVVVGASVPVVVGATVVVVVEGTDEDVVLVDVVTPVVVVVPPVGFVVHGSSGHCGSVVDVDVLVGEVVEEVVVGAVVEDVDVVVVPGSHVGCVKTEAHQLCG
jgi:hypothetical protein